MYSVNVYFTYTNRRYWWTRFLKTGFSHCYVLIPVTGGHILLSNNKDCFQYEYIQTGQELPKNLQKTAIMVKYYTNVNHKGGWFGPITCVSIVKKVLGIRKPFIFTPYQLYRYLSWVDQKSQKLPRSN